MKNTHIRAMDANAQMLNQMARTTAQLARSLGFGQKQWLVSKQQNTPGKKEIPGLPGNERRPCW